MAPVQLGAFTRSLPDHAWPNLEPHVQPLPQGAFGQPLHRFDAITAGACNRNPASRGSVANTSPTARIALRIQPGDLSTGEDRQLAVESLRLVRRIAAIPALAGCRRHEIKPGPEFQADDQLTRLAGDIATPDFTRPAPRKDPR